jgi:hypothetical protein
VGSLAESITVTGDSPTVDIQNVTQQKVMTRDVLNAIPAGMKSTGQIGVLIPGVTSTSQDVGGTAFSAVGLAIHGSRLNEQAALYDGMNFNNGPHPRQLFRPQPAGQQPQRRADCTRPHLVHHREAVV